VTTLRSDVLVLGGTLSGLVAATYLARAGLRVVLVEEDAQTKRPALLREPFLLPGLAADGSLGKVLRELALPLLEQREFGRDKISLQVVLPDARLDVSGEDEEFALEIDRFGLAKPDEVLGWLASVREVADAARRTLWDVPVTAERAGIARYVPSRASATPRVRAALPAAPGRLGAVARALIGAATQLADPGESAAPALLVDAARRGNFRLPNAGHSFLDLFRRRFRALHGEFREVDRFALISDRHEVGIELPRGQVYARAMVIAVPREPLRRFARESGPLPRWLRPGLAPLQLEQRLFRAEPSAIPAGMAARLVVAGEDPDSRLRISLYRDPAAERVCWLLVSGPGAAAIHAARPLGPLAPFPGPEMIPVDIGARPEWDIDSDSAGFPQAQPADTLRSRPLLAHVGGEAVAGLGVEGEVLQARRAALTLAHRLGARAPAMRAWPSPAPDPLG
jgi:hypothetical protein